MWWQGRHSGVKGDTAELVPPPPPPPPPQSSTLVHTGLGRVICCSTAVARLKAVRSRTLYAALGWHSMLRAANIVLRLVLMYLPKILILKYSKIPRSLLNTTTTLIYTQHTLYILSCNKTLLSGRKVHAYLALFLAISSSSLVSSTLLLHSVSLQVLLEVLELCNQVSTHRHPSWDTSAGLCACAAIEELEIWREIRILKRS